MSFTADRTVADVTTRRSHRKNQASLEPTATRTLTVEQAGALLGISRGLAYASVTDGTIPSVRIGRRILVPTALLSALLGESPSNDDGSGPAEPLAEEPADAAATSRRA